MLGVDEAVEQLAADRLHVHDGQVPVPVLAQVEMAGDEAGIGRIPFVLREGRRGGPGSAKDGCFLRGVRRVVAPLGRAGERTTFVN